LPNYRQMRGDRRFRYAEIRQSCTQPF
jgi:hypothetical protein